MIHSDMWMGTYTITLLCPAMSTYGINNSMAHREMYLSFKITNESMNTDHALELFWTKF